MSNYTIDDLPFDEYLAELANGYGIEEIELHDAVGIDSSDLSFSAFDTVGSA